MSSALQAPALWEPVPSFLPSGGKPELVSRRELRAKWGLELEGRGSMHPQFCSFSVPQVQASRELPPPSWTWMVSWTGQLKWE